MHVRILPSHSRSAELQHWCWFIGDQTHAYSQASVSLAVGTRTPFAPSPPPTFAGALNHGAATPMARDQGIESCLCESTI
jgi:hypothetical protein